MMAPARHPTRASVRWLRALNFSVAEIQLGLGPFVALYLQSTAHWNPARIGAALAIGNIVQVLVQTPIGATIDRYRLKRILIGVATVLVGLACGGMLWTPVEAPVVWGTQALIGFARAVFPPALSAVTLGMFGKAGMDEQTGISQSFNAAGSVCTAVAFGWAGYAFGLPAIFYLALALCAASLFCVTRLRGEEIDFEAARGNEGAAAEQDQNTRNLWKATRDLTAALAALARDRPVRRFLLCTVLFYVADVAMVPLLTQILGKGLGARPALVMTSAYVVASQVLFIGIAPVCGRLSKSIGRKPLLLFAFAALAVRAGLYAVVDRHPYVLLAIQCSDAFSTGVFGVLGVLVISDFTRNSGRFNAAQGAVATVQGLGSFLSNAIAGYVAEAAGTRVAFLMLAGVAVVAFVVALSVPETRDRASGQHAER